MSAQDNDFFEYSTGAATVYCRQSITIDNTFGWKGSVCLVYAEVIEIAASCSFPGKSLGLFCNQLTIAPSAPVPVVIDVSGAPGPLPSPLVQTAQAGTKGSNGSVGGTIWLSIESLDKDLEGLLAFRANGGPGSDGGTSTASGFAGGNGGNGASGGSVSIFYGNPASLLINSFLGNTLPWPAAVTSFLSNDTTTRLQALEARGLDSNRVSTWSAVLARYNDLNTQASAILGLCDTIVSSSSNKNARQPSADLVTALTNLQTSIGGMYTPAGSAPDVADDTLNKSLLAIATTLNGWVGGSTTATDAQIASSINSLTIPKAEASGDALHSAITAISFALTTCSMSIDTKLQGLCTVYGGDGGGAGAGDPGVAAASQGNIGANGSITMLQLAYDGGNNDLSASQVLAFPEQCQMMLNDADQLYFSSNTDSTAATWQTAQGLYQRLTTRLAFVAALQTQTTAALAEAYQTVETLGLTVQALDQLSSVFSLASSRLRQMSLGHDIFGYAIDWVPRLSLATYYSDAVTMTSNLSTLETDVNTYTDTSQKQAQTQTSLKACIDQAQTTISQSQSEVQLLMSPNGPLQTNAFAAASLTPLLQASRQSIKTAVTQVAQDIQNALKLDPIAIINALATIAVAPKPMAVLAQKGVAAYTAVNSVTDDQGNTVSKKIALTELGNAGDSLQSLTEAYSLRTDQTLEPDDPSSIKLLTDTDTVTKFLQQFASAIPSADSKALQQSMQDYINLVLQRNDYLLAYNAAWEVLCQAVINMQTAQKQTTHLTAQYTALDPALPTLTYWLKKLVNTSRLQIMNRQDLCGRAIMYWGLTLEPKFTAPSGLSDSIVLAANNQTLQSAFNTALTQFGSSIASYWPTNDSSQGTMYKLTADQLNALKTPQTDPNSSGKSTYRTTLTLYQDIPNPFTNNALFKDQVNIRIYQLRLWLPNIKVTPNTGTTTQPVTIRLTAQGSETIRDATGKDHRFTHDNVSLQFNYNAQAVAGLADCTQDKVTSTQELQASYKDTMQPDKEVLAPIGPWTMWALEVRESENPGLDMTAVNEAYLEFHGMSQMST